MWHVGLAPDLAFLNLVDHDSYQLFFILILILILVLVLAYYRSSSLRSIQLPLAITLSLALIQLRGSIVMIAIRELSI